MLSRSNVLCIVLALGLAGCAEYSELEQGRPYGAPPVEAPPSQQRLWPTDQPARPLPAAANRVLDGFDRPQPVLVLVPPPSTFENSCAPEPYIFQSNAGYEAVRVKDCRHDQLLYLPATETARIGRYVEECKRICGGQQGPVTP